MKSQNLVGTIFARDVGLDGAGFYRVYALKVIAIDEQLIISVMGLAAADDLVKTANILFFQSHG